MASSAAATELAREGVTLLLLHVPQHTVLGVDTQVFSVGPRFGGIDQDGAPRPAFRPPLLPQQVVVRRRHLQEEEIRYSEAVKLFEFDDQLGPYTSDSFGDWKQLSSYLSRSVIERLEPIG